jgi:hypothetical protein
MNPNKYIICKPALEQNTSNHSHNNFKEIRSTVNISVNLLVNRKILDEKEK